MKLRLAVVLLTLTSACFGWNCTTPGQVRVQVPTGTKGTGTGDGSGQVVVDNGLPFVCETLPTGTGNTKTTNNTNTNTNTNANTNNNSNTNNNTLVNNTKISNTLAQKQQQAQQQQQKQNQSQTATGGNATSNAQGGNAASNASAANNGNNSNNTVENQVRQAPGAEAPLILPTASCLGGISTGGSSPVGGLSFGKSTVDKECRSIVLANEFIAMGNYDTAAKVLCSTKSAKAAGLTIDDCRRQIPVPPVIVREVAPAPIVEVVVVRESPVLPVVALAPPAPPVVAKKRIVHKRKPCITKSEK